MANENDDTKADGKQATDSSTDNKQTGNGREADNNTSAQKDEYAIPKYRFDEVSQERNDYKAKLDAAQKEIEAYKTSKPKEEETDPATWKEVEDRAVKKALSQIEDKLSKDKAETAETEAMIERDFNRLEAVGQKITPELRKATLEEMVKTGGDVFDAFLTVKGKFKKSEEIKQLKEDGSVPESRTGSEDNKGNISYKQIHNLSMDQLIEISKTKK